MWLSFQIQRSMPVRSAERELIAINAAALSREEVGMANLGIGLVEFRLVRWELHPFMVVAGRSLILLKPCLR